MKKIIVSFIFFALYLPLVSIAHPGHGSTEGYTITHYFTEPVHVVVSLSVIIVAVIFARYTSRTKQQKENS